MRITRSMMFSAMLIVTLHIAASEPNNFARCRDGRGDCDRSLLSPEQVRIVEAFRSGRNLRACVDRGPSCELLRLTPQQTATLQHMRDEERKAAYLAPILASARNFAACAHGESTCDPNALTAEQVVTLRKLFIEASITQSQAPAPVDMSRRELVQNSATAPSRSEPEQRRGSRFLQVLGALAEAYLEVEGQRATTTPIFMSGRGASVASTNYPQIVSGTPVIEGQIDGTFQGWSGETIFKLTNGQIWQQSSYAYYYHYAYRPKVVIYLSGGTYRMQVDGVSTAISVVRLH